MNIYQLSGNSKLWLKKSNHKFCRVRGDAELHQSTEAQDFFNEEGLEFEPTSPYSPEQNGTAERSNESGRSESKFRRFRQSLGIET
jgi:hypothetical protein